MCRYSKVYILKLKMCTPHRFNSVTICQKKLVIVEEYNCMYNYYISLLVTDLTPNSTYLKNQTANIIV